MGVENFIPQIWSSKLFVRLRKALVHAATVNSDYEGEISQHGDTVHINEIGPITINDYTKNTDITFQTLTSADKTLVIDQSKYFAFSVDDVDQAQTKPKLMNGAMSEAAYAMADTIDQHIAGKYTKAGSTVTALTVTVANSLITLSKMSTALNEKNVPQAGRFLPIPPWLHQHLLNAATASITATGVPKLLDNGLLVNGFVGRLYGFDLLMSNNVNNNATVWNVMGYNMTAITFANQIAKVEAVDVEKQFGDAIKGLSLYGCKVVRPNAMVKCAMTKG